MLLLKSPVRKNGRKKGGSSLPNQSEGEGQSREHLMKRGAGYVSTGPAAWGLPKPWGWGRSEGNRKKVAVSKKKDDCPRARIRNILGKGRRKRQKVT